MASIKMKLKKFGRYTWELFKTSIPTSFMYFCAGTILMMLLLREEKPVWDGKDLAWTIVCIVGACAYNALMAWASGGQEYEMLVSGNMKRMSQEQFEGGYKISSHKEAKEYRVWKGFVIGCMTAIFPLLFSLLFGCFQTRIDAGQTKGFLAVIMLLGFLLSGWTVLPFYVLNLGGASYSYFLGCILALLPIIVTGGVYIGGAYGRRAKRLREQLIAQKAQEAEEQKTKKINYGGLPGTKPKKRK
ncbi:MAG: hypothetical protein E7377_01155 [Clostridiales bacterium]|nr:hypothetical protein [Clostridiales bacterium]